MYLERSEILNSPFNVEIHKKHFSNYLEVVIHPDGKTEYAVPSHKIKLAMIAYTKATGEEMSYERTWTCDKFRAFNENIPSDFWGSMINYYCNVTKCVCVWNDKIVIPETGLTEQQSFILKMLFEEGLLDI